jgi:hypothetical protein
VAILFAKGFLPRELPSAAPKAAGEASPAEQVITLHYHERPPYYITGPLGVYGLCADPAKLAFKRAGIPIRWEKTPASRQLGILKTNRGRDCLLGWFKNPERERFARYSVHIYEDRPTVALALAGNDNIISGRPLADTLLSTDLTLLRKSGYSYGRYIDAMVSKLLPRQDMTDAENVGMLKMIHSRRADYFFISEEEAHVLTATSGLPQNDFKFIRFADMPTGNKRYLLFSKKVAVEEVARIDAAIKTYVHGQTGH